MTEPNGIHLHADVSGHGSATMAGRDLHVHYESGARRVAGAVDVEDCPYPGLAAFTADQTSWFFGRDTLTAHLVGRLADRLDGGAPLVVVGPSGAGKSSLLHAGLIAAITERAVLPVAGSRRWPQLVFTPTGQPLDALVERLADVFDVGEDQVREWVTDPETLVTAVRVRLRADARLIVVVDQLEELFTLCPNVAQRRTFLELLDALAHTCGLVVYGLRADAYSHCVEHPPLREALQDSQIIVGPMSAAELRQAVVFPARDVGLEVEPGLVELLLRDLGAGDIGGYEAGRLPLLAHALRALWRERHGHLLTVDAYRATGGIHDAIATTAERVYARLDEPQRQAARTVFLRLVKIGDGTDDTRRPVVRADLAENPVAITVLDAFTDGRLLTRDQDTVTITHEALLRAWPRLRSWIDDDRADNLTRQQLEEAAAGWDREDRDPALLYRGTRLAVARNLVRESPGRLTPVGTAFHAASVHQHARGVRRRRMLVVVLAVLVLIAGAAPVVVLSQLSQARTVKEQTAVSKLVTAAQGLRSAGKPDDLVLASQLDLVAWDLRHDPADPVVAMGLADDTSMVLPIPLDVDVEFGTQKSFVAFSPDSRLLAVAADNPVVSVVELWQVSDPGHPKALKELWRGSRTYETGVKSLSFSPEGSAVVVTHGDGWIRVLPLADGKPGEVQEPAELCSGLDQQAPTDKPREIKVPCTGYSEIATYLDNRTLAIGHFDKGPGFSADHDISTFRLWHPGEPAASEQIHDTEKRAGLLTANSAAHLAVVGVFDADEHGVLRNPHLRLWDKLGAAAPRARGVLDTRIDPFGGPVPLGAVSVSLSPDAHWLAVLEGDATASAVTLWDLSDTDRPTRRGSIPSGNSFGETGVMAFSPHGDVLATVQRDNAIHMWKLTDPARPEPFGQALTGHHYGIDSFQYSPDGHFLASVGRNGGTDTQASFRLWDLNVEENVRRLCATTPRVSQELWQKYVPELTYHPPCA
ncbi:NACHT and WD repeat domain-containing protein [Actinocrispum wychmicini]|uniref:WD40 repeat protein n=1 Tax=Actinocrispum wychmicini TaxID=1213861 RepID=A0A4R2JHR7_9PSEU|nr:NACHT and WD repeat domain-containing protein [Actinocrispum wychmicini]TCO53665.1 WD40 repeat protein [Actinocrispum wychmicini]